MSQNPPPPPRDPPPGAEDALGLQLVGQGTPRGQPRVEDMTLRLLRDMRAEHAASMEAMRTELAATRRVHADMDRVFNRLDEIKTELTAFRAETGKSLRQLEGDMITAEGQNMSRQIEILDAVKRIADIEMTLPPAD